MRTKTKTKTQVKTKQHIIYEDSLAGVQFSDYQRVAGIRAGRTIKLLWEPSNPHDSRAVKVMLDEVHIGYIKAKHTGIFHEHREAGNRVLGEIVSYNRTNPTWAMIVIRCWVLKELPEDVEL